MTKVLITGASGFIGSHVAKALETKGHIVKGYDKQDGQDVLDDEELEKTVNEFNPEVIVHLAAQVYLGPSLKDPQVDAMTNILGTLNVLETARKHLCKVVFSSSGAVYGSNDRSNISEGHSPEPMSPYGVSKLAAETYCLLYNRLYDIPVTIFRFSSVYGKGRKKTSIQLILDKATKQLKMPKFDQDDDLSAYIIYVTGDGWQTRDFTDVSDVAEAIVMSVDGKFPSGIYNIGTGKSTSINVLIKMIEDLLGQKLIINYIAKSKGDPLRNDFNVEKAERYGFKAKVSLRNGLERLIKEHADN